MTKRLYTTHIRYRLHIVSYTPSLSPHATMLSKWQIANGMKNIFYFFFILAISPNFACLLWKWARFFSILCSLVPPWPRSNAVARSFVRSNVIFSFFIHYPVILAFVHIWFTLIFEGACVRLLVGPLRHGARFVTIVHQYIIAVWEWNLITLCAKSALYGNKSSWD